MKIVLFYHSLVSDWNHGNAHFLRGVASELLSRGHLVDIYEPANGWSYSNLVRESGQQAVDKFHLAFPNLKSICYHPQELDVPKALDEAGLVIVHEWTPPSVISSIGRARKLGAGFRLLFHDTHHRLLTDPGFEAIDLSGYDGVLAFGEALRRMYLEKGLAANAWTWHEAADTRVFKPIKPESGAPMEDLVFIGNWGDGEREKELREYFVKPSSALQLKTAVYGVRYPARALKTLFAAGIDYRGWAPNYEVPEIFSHFRATVHVPRSPYSSALEGIPTIRVFEALACGIPLVCAPWIDSENLFTPGRDFLLAANPLQMKSHLKDLLNDAPLASRLSENGLAAIRQRHTCAHRVDELLSICNSLTGIKEYAGQA
ncbi:MAG: glycosyltransferase [Nitrospiraceae bacterium]|nr:glycosyltransferase [Nitrospiraceae bacterium]